jgi:zinc transporter 1
MNERLSFKKSSNDSPKKYHHTRDSWHATHNHSKPKDQTVKRGHGHSHGDLNMRGLFLHIMGDALGNIGVITSALIIWLTSFKWRFYVDPAMSLVITVIILCSAIPLCKAASRILLQAVPRGLNVDDIKQDIEALPAVISTHHLHIWQLSNTKFIASLHVRVDYALEGTGSTQYMHLATQIRRCLRRHGIHSSTIQPEFCLPPDNQSPEPGSCTTVASTSGQVSPTMDNSYLLACRDDCITKN